MPRFNVNAPDGSIIPVDAPEGATEQQAIEFAAKAWKPSQTMQPTQQTQAAPEKKQTLLDRFKSGLGNVGAGALKGASDIGATILSPLDYAGLTGMTSEQRRAAVTQGLQDMGADTESLAYKGGELASGIAGTAGAGGLLAKGVMTGARIAPAIIPKIASSLETGGLSLGENPVVTGRLANAAMRVGGGAASGAAMSGLTNPSDAGIGALIGGAIPVAGRVMSATIPAVLGTTTGAGQEAIKQAYRSGKAGGSTQDLFAANMRGEVPAQDVLDTVKSNIQQMSRDKALQYRTDMAHVSGDKSILNFTGIDSAVKNANDLARFEGKIKNSQAADAVNKISEIVNDWKSSDPAKFHTPEGLDALKQSVGGVLEGISYEQKTARKAAGDIYNSIKNEISQQAPVYSKAMKDYSTSSELISEIEKSLSQGKKASADTGMRKLQSLMRNNVNTNYGSRLEMAQKLEQQGGREFIPAIAGQALNTLTPRGLQGASSLPTAYLGYGAGGVPLAAAGLLAGSPRLVGEAALKAGQAARVIPKGSNALTRAALYKSTGANQ